MLNIITLVLGPVQTNCYLVCDTESNSVIVIDPAWDGEGIVKSAEAQNWHIEEIWLTHAHFDHLAGIAGVTSHLSKTPSIALHAEDLPLWEIKGGGPFFGIEVETGPKPNVELTHGQILHVGKYDFEVRHAPGHTPGHVVFYCEKEAVMFCGDVIFQGSIGRTDLPGGDYQTLINSIKMQVLSLPDDTRIFSGHGQETTVGEERKFNPFLS